MSRQFAPEVFNALKTATKLVINALGGLEAAATCCRVGKSQLSDYCNINGDKFILADVTMELERVAGTPFLTAALALTAGYTLVPIEPLRERNTLAMLLSAIGKDTGELFATAAMALGHAQPTDDERTRMLAELSDLHRLTGETIRHLQADDAA